MMHQLIGKKQKIFFFIFILFFLSNIDNLNLIQDRKDFININQIEVKGLEKNLNLQIKKDLIFLKKLNIFFFNKEKIEKKLGEYNYIESYYVNKIFPSKIIVNLQPTKFLATTIKKNQ